MNNRMVQEGCCSSGSSSNGSGSGSGGAHSSEPAVLEPTTGTQGRYPERKRRQVNYYEPDDDHFICKCNMIKFVNS